MQICPTLQAVQRKYVKFDPNNDDHLAAFYSLCFQHRQHPTLRFELEESYESVPSMMLHQVGYQVVAGRVLNKDAAR